MVAISVSRWRCTVANRPPRIIAWNLPARTEKVLLQSFAYQLEAGDAVTSTFRVEVTQPPSATISEVIIVPPEYTRLPTTSQKKSGEIDGWVDSSVTLHAVTNIPVKSAELILTEKGTGSSALSTIPMRVSSGTGLTAEWKLALPKTGGSPPFVLHPMPHLTGQSDPEPLRYPLNIRVDAPPDRPARSEPGHRTSRERNRSASVSGVRSRFRSPGRQTLRSPEWRGSSRACGDF